MKLIVAILFISTNVFASSIPIDQLTIVSEVGHVAPSGWHHGPREGWPGHREGRRREGWYRGRYERWARRDTVSKDVVKYPSPKLATDKTR